MAMLGSGMAAAGTTSAFGLGLFNYNRGNYMYDASFRFERFSAGREFAIEQMDQYRDDLRKLSELTAKKCGMYSIFSSLGMALCVALYCAGRLGLHGPSPPMHVMGLWLTCNAAAFAYYVAAIWLSVHAMYRSSSASTQLLTRKARVPVPSLKQLDKARRFASEFEQQDWGDIFRIPYINNPGCPVREEQSGRASSEPPQRRRNKESSWARDEFDTEKAGAVAGPAHMADTTPEHFQLYTKVQKHWIQYDVYARVSLLYGYLSFVHSLAYYGLGHINVELRAWWVAYACPFVITTLLFLLIKFDIVPNKADQNDWYSLTIWFGPAAVLPAAIAMSLDFRVEFNLAAIAFTWIFIFLSYSLQLVYTLRLFWILIPEKEAQADDKVGDPWWPEGWELPTRFQHVLYMVAPPARLKPGQNDIVRELKEGHLDPALSGGKGHLNKDDIDIRVKYLDRTFEWIQQECWDKLSPSDRTKVQQLHGDYVTKRKSWVEGKHQDLDAMSSTIAMCVEGLAPIKNSMGGDEPMGGAMSDVAESSDAEGYDVRSRQRKAPPLFEQSKHIQPKNVVMWLTGALVFSWCFLLVGNIVDCIIGEQGTLTAPHWSRPPMTRLSYVPHDLGTPLGLPWPASARPYLPENMRWHEEKRIATADTLFHAGGFPAEAGAPGAISGGHRRLEQAAEYRGFGVQAQGLRDAIEGLMEVLPEHSAGTRKVVSDAQAEQISWPGLFEPRLLACGPRDQDGGSMVAALTQRGFGAAARLGAVTGVSAAEAFKLAGVSHLPPLVGASWGEDGLTLVSRAGDLATCPGSRPAAGGAWACGPHQHAPARLPVEEGTKLLAAAAAMLNGPGGAGGEPRVHAAIVHESAPDLVALFHLEGASWLPLGEVAVPARVDGALGPAKVSLALSSNGDLTVATNTGAVIRRRLRDGSIIGSAAPGKSQQTWQGGCHVQFFF